MKKQKNETMPARLRIAATVIMLTQALMPAMAATDFLAPGFLKSETAQVEGIELDGRNAAAITAKITTAAPEQTVYRTFSVLLPEPLDLTGKQLRFHLQSPDGKEILAVYVRLYNRDESKPVWSFVNYASPLRDGAFAALLQPGRNNGSMNWEAEPYGGRSDAAPDRIDRIRFYFGSRTDQAELKIILSGLTVEELNETDDPVRYAEPEAALPDFFRPANLSSRGGDFAAIRENDQDMLQLSGRTRDQKNTNYFIGVIKLPRLLDLTGQQLKFDATASAPDSILALVVRFYNAGETKPCWSFLKWGSPFPPTGRISAGLFAGQEEGPLPFQPENLSGTAPEKIDRIEFWLGSTTPEVDIQARFGNFSFARAPQLKEKKPWPDRPAYADRPARVAHPAGSVKQEYIERAKANIARHAWAKEQLAAIRKGADFWMKFTPEEVIEMIPAGDAFFKCLCPNCGTQPEFAWQGDVLQDDLKSIRCTNCKMIFPNEQYPENSSYTIKTVHGKEKTIQYYHGKDQIAQGENYGPRYHLTGAVNYVKIRNIRQIYYPALYYALTGEPGYAERVREVLLRFAEVYPDYSPKYRATAYESPRGHFMAGKLCAWKFHDSAALPMVINAYSLTYNSGHYSEEDKLKIENGICREFQHLITAFPVDKDICLNAVPAHMTTAALCAAMLGDHDLMSYVLDGKHGFVDFVRNYYHRDGFWFENTPSYANMANAPLVTLALTLQGYTDSPDYAGEDRYEHFDVFETIPELKLVFTGMAPGVLPTGFLPATNDSSFDARQGVAQLELAAAVTGDPADQAMAGYFARHYGTAWDASFSLLLRNPEQAGDNGEAPAELQHTRIFPGVGWASLRRPESWRDSAAVIYYGPYAGGHSHNCTLSYLYCDFGKEVISDLGYLSWWHDNRTWINSILAHNLVMVDGKAQQNSRWGKPELIAGDSRILVFRAEAGNAYPGVTRRYARTLFNLPLPDGRQYLVDFFEVDGGADHSWIFHADGEKFTAPESLQFADFDAKSLGGPQTGVGFLSEARAAALPAGAHVFEWQYDESIRTRLFYLTERAEQVITAVAPGLRDSKTPYEKIKLNLLVARSEGPRSIFTAVIESDRGEPQITAAERLTSVGDRPVTAVKVATRQGTDIILQAAPGRETIQIKEYPELEFSGGGAAVVRLDREGRVLSLWLEGDGKLKFGSAELAGLPALQGKITAVDPDGRKITTGLSALPDYDFAGNYLVAEGLRDGAYRLEGAELRDGKAVFTLAPHEVIRLQPGVDFTINPYREKEFPTQEK